MIYGLKAEYGPLNKVKNYGTLRFVWRTIMKRSGKRDKYQELEHEKYG